MAFEVTKENVSDDNPALGQNVTIDLSSRSGSRGVDTIETSPQWQENKWNTFSATISATTAGKDLGALLFHEDKKGGLERVRGSSPYNNSMYAIKEPEDIKKIAANLGIPAEVIGKIGYEQEAQAVTRIGVTFREGVDPAPHYNNFVLALEAKGFVPRGTAFEMGEQGLSDPGQVQANIVGEGNGEKLESFAVGAAQNKTGISFRIWPTASGGSEIFFGKEVIREGSFCQEVSREDFAAAEKIAAIVSGRLTGEAGVTGMGVSIAASHSPLTVLDHLAKVGLISPAVAEQAAAYKDFIPAQPMPVRKPAVPRLGKVG
jgi:hypothetical protein